MSDDAPKPDLPMEFDRTGGSSYRTHNLHEPAPEAPKADDQLAALNAARVTEAYLLEHLRDAKARIAVLENRVKELSKPRGPYPGNQLDSDAY